MGAHLDYNGGAVLPTAINRGTVVAVSPRSDGVVRFTSSLEAGDHEFELARLPAEKCGTWADYPSGIVRAMLSYVGAAPDGASFHFGGNLPIGAGLSSSASICVGTSHALASVWGLELEPIDPVHIALSAEREFVGVQCGIMDPYAVGLAQADHLLWLECSDVRYEYVPLDSERLSILVADTGVRRALAASEFNQRVEECRRAFEVLRRAQPEAACLAQITMGTLGSCADELDPVLARRAAHVIAEVERTVVAREGLLHGRPEILGEKMMEAHASLRGLYEVSCPELDRLVEAAGRCDEVLGGRLTGAGFGGACVFLIERGSEEAVRARLEESFREAFNHDPTVAVFQASGGPFELAL
jgi:galactokinase